MNFDQKLIRDFLENIILENRNLYEDGFEDMDFDEFCRYYEIGNGLAEKMDIKDFPFEDWQNDYYNEYLKECKENSIERSQQFDDYRRAVGF
ncbi:MAG: hypothetical protein Q4A27_00160 [bacterium]|jgi:hypothetical protein|nr:hypothetical protein [Candidatus Saccharibacteria bacterium]MDO4871836.1 hypothetical protein [bacterium]DAP28149.1 MAG TPA: hypothetical protein [Caudoviricetes sp.]DAS12355.1 MAG TPA: hypothetical protein [Caudoviricetes sp.]